MSRLICKFQVVGPVQTNCYFLYREDTKDCVIVDPGDEAKRIKKFIEDQELHPVAILLTHGHFDHVMAVDSVRTAYHIPVYAAEAEKETTICSLQPSTSSSISSCLAVSKFASYLCKPRISAFKASG